MTPFVIQSDIPIPPARITEPKPVGACSTKWCRNIPERGYKLCASCRITSARENRRYRKLRMESGLCAWAGCDSPPKDGKTMCQNHLDSMLRNNTNMRARRKAAGMCIQCNERPRWFSVYCPICRSEQHHCPPNSLPVGAKRALKMYRRLESIDGRRAKAESMVALIDDDRDHRIISLRHGLVDGIDHTLEEIALEMQITRERVRQIEGRTLKLLEYRGFDVSILRPPFNAVQRHRKKPSQTSKEQKKKNRAHKLVADAIKRGDITKQPCHCGEIRTVAHHRDYDKPLEVEWLCRSHHMEAHGRGNGTRVPIQMRASRKPHCSTWLNKVISDNGHYNATLIATDLRRHHIKQRDLQRATGLPRAVLLNVVHGHPVADEDLLTVLRFCQNLPIL
jgi:sigma-70-like protein